jgi:hypothetical protein
MVGCGSSKDRDSGDGGNHNWNQPDGALTDGRVQDADESDSAGPCTENPVGRTGTTIYLFDQLGQETGDPVTVGTEVTVSIRITIDQPPAAGAGFLQIAARNLTVDATSFELDGSPLSVPDPFLGRIPLALPQGNQEVTFTATVQSQQATVEVDAHLRYGSAAACEIPRSHSLAILQVLGGVEKGVDCYDLDQARSEQVSPYVPLQSTSDYLNANGTWDLVEIDKLVVGTPPCPAPGVLVHQISKCFIRSEGSTITLSGNAYGGVPWFVDDFLMVELLDENEEVVAAYTTYQVSDQQLGCCVSPPCTTELTYAQGGPLVTIGNEVQGGGDNGNIAAAVFDLTSYLPQSGTPFYLRFTALDQGIEGALDRVFLNIDYP